MKTMQSTKRLYTVIPRTGSAASSLSHSTPQSASLSRPSRPGSSAVPGPDRRSLYTQALPLHYLDAGAPPLPPQHSSSRSGNSQVAVTSRLQQSGEFLNGHSSPSENNTQQSLGPYQQQAPLLGPPSVTLASTLPSSSSGSVDRLGFTSTSPLFPYQLSSGLLMRHEAPWQEEHTSGESMRFLLDVGACGIPKRGRKNNYLEPRGLGLATQVGEDAYFVRDNAMGVADGVGGWSRASASASLDAPVAGRLPSPSALFARRLMHFCSHEVGQATACACSPPGSHVPSSPSPTAAEHSHSHRIQLRGGTAVPVVWPPDGSPTPDYPMESRAMDIDQTSAALDPVKILDKAYSSAVATHCTTSSTRLSPDLASRTLFVTGVEQPLLTGSSTALLAVLSGKTLRVAHLGDCTGLLVRDGDVVWRTEEMWWGFNCPVQLGPTTPARPADARTYEMEVQEGDILILASDGMSDNLWEEDILDEVQRFRRVHLRTDNLANRLAKWRNLASMLSEALCSRAKTVSEIGRNTRPDTLDGEIPFARRAREDGRVFDGGKCDGK